MAGELGDVIGGDTIAAGFTNAVKDRTVMRYATAVDRDTLVPAPVEGDMAYLQDSDQLTMFRGGVWSELVWRGQTGNINAQGSDFITSGNFIANTPGEFIGTLRGAGSTPAYIVTPDGQFKNIRTTITGFPGAGDGIDLDLNVTYGTNNDKGLWMKVSGVWTKITASPEDVTNLQTQVDQIDVTLLDFENRITALENA